MCSDIRGSKKSILYARLSSKCDSVHGGGVLHVDVSQRDVAGVRRWPVSTVSDQRSVPTPSIGE